MTQYMVNTVSEVPEGRIYGACRLGNLQSTGTLVKRAMNPKPFFVVLNTICLK